GLRNVTRKERALAEMRRVLRPGGVALVLEFSLVAGRLAPASDGSRVRVVRESSRLPAPLAPASDWYSFTVLPRLGKVVADDEASYRYLAESIRVHPDQETLKKLMEDAGFERVDYHNLTAGVVAVHVGRVY